MKKKAVNKVVWVKSAIALFFGYLICRYLFFNLHGMKAWPLILLVFGLTAIIPAIIFSALKVLASIPLGYIGGFAIGMLFYTEGVDPGGGKKSNAWVIWTLSFLVIIFVGFVWELISRYKKE